MHVYLVHVYNYSQGNANPILFYHYLSYYRWGKGTRQKHGGYFSGPDRYDPGKLVKHKWESATTVDKKAWAHRKNIKLEELQDIEVNG